MYNKIKLGLIKEECSICGNRNRCKEAYTEKAIACKRIMEVVIKEQKRQDNNYYINRRFEFECDFCSECPDRKVCKNVYEPAKCKILYKALEDEGLLLKKKEVEEKVEEKVVQFPVDMDKMQKNILVGLLSARKECTNENILTARGCVAIIDALFYLVKEKPIWMGIDWGDPKGSKQGGID